MKGEKFLWWQKGVIYEVYPRSFKDSNGNGIGDLNGIIEKLDYLQWLGIDAVWVGPFYPSPMKDFGYDVSDYTDVHELFGDLKTFDKLVQEVHSRQMKIIIDFVPNHTSNEHPWFETSSSSRDNQLSEWYLWQDGDKDGNPPNNWLSVFGGSAWEWNEKRKQFYYHAFLKDQPDLNLRNAEVQKAISDVMRFWLERGVDGFRVDVMWHLYKDSLWRNNPVNPDYEDGQPEYDKLKPFYTTDHADVIEIVKKLRSVIDEFDERVMIGEMYLSVDQTVTYYGPDNNGAHLPGNFTLLLLPWNARKIAAAVDECESSLPRGAWPNWVLGNHDRPRLATRAGEAQLRVAAMLLLTLRGTPTMYYGDEIGIAEVDIPEDRMQDPQGKKMGVSRDAYRTPMQWDTGKHAGFTSASEPWLPLEKNASDKNIVTQQKDEKSLLNLYRELLSLRRNEAALHTGVYVPVPATGDVLAYERISENRRVLIVLNLGDEATTFKPKGSKVNGTVMLDTELSRKGDQIHEKIELGANEGLIILLE